jgi:hypothetical protein
METIGWIYILGTLFLGACALFVPYLAEIVKRKAFAPNLKILFELAPPFCHQTSWRSPLGSPTQIEEPVYYFRFQVANEGKTQARLCEVVSENLWIYDSANNPQPYPNFSPVNMIWVGASNEFININPNRRVFCDIGHISSQNYQREIEQNRFIDILGYRGNDLRFVLDLRQIFYSQPNCLGPGRYILQVGLYSENAGYQKEFFDISWSGIWQDGDDEMFREIVITRTKNPI